MVDAARAPDDRVLAPDLFWWRLQRIHRFVAANLAGPPDYDWVIVHKGDVAAFPRPFADAVLATMTPVFANEVFVVFSARADAVSIGLDDDDVAPFVHDARDLPIEPTATLHYEADRVFGSEPLLVDFLTLSPAETRTSYNTFFGRGGYRYPTLRDRAYYDDIHGWLARCMERWSGRRVLEVCCAAVPFIDRTTASTVVRTDLSHGAVHAARDADRAGATNAALLHGVVDAEMLAFANGSFDAVAFVDAIEHVVERATRVRRSGAGAHTRRRAPPDVRQPQQPQLRVAPRARIRGVAHQPPTPG